jgi:hypothetical protein
MDGQLTVIVVAVIAVLVAILIPIAQSRWQENQWYGSTEMTESFDTNSELRYNSLAATQTNNSLNRLVPVNDMDASRTNATIKRGMDTVTPVPESGGILNTTMKNVSTSAAVPKRNQIAAEAAICEKQAGVGTCAMLDDPAFSQICGVCIKGGTKSTDTTPGKWVGGLYMDNDDRESINVMKTDAQPTVGACPPGFFFVDRASCDKGVNRMQCSDAGVAGGWSGPSAPIVDAKCAQAIPGGPYVYDTKKRSFLVNLRCIVPNGTGKTIVNLYRVDSNGARGKQIGNIEMELGRDALLTSWEPVIEGDTLELDVVQEFATHTKGQKEVYAVGRPGYTFTQNTTKMVCISLGAEVATTAQVEEAQGAGADWCASGHVSNGSPLYPIQVKREGCGEKGINRYGTQRDLRVATCYGIKPVINDDYSITNTKVYPFAEQPSIRSSRFGRIDRGVRAFLAQWENTYDPKNAYKTAIPFEGTVSSATKRLGNFGNSGLIPTPRAKNFPQFLSNQYWIWSGTAQKAIFRCTVPATFLPPVYNEDVVLTVGKPLISQRSSLQAKKTSPCKTPPYSAECLISLFTSAGGDGAKGTLSPTIGGANAINELQRQGDQDAIFNYVSQLYELATTGMYENGSLASREYVNEAAMKLFGFEIASPCEEIVAGSDGTVGLLPKEAPITPECMDFLYKNAGSDQSRGQEEAGRKSTVKATYISIGDRYSGIRKGEYGVSKAQKARTPFQTCTPDGTIAPMKNGRVDLNAVQKITSSTDGSIDGIQGMFNRIFQTANTDGSQDTLSACFGITPTSLFKSNLVAFQSKNFPTRYITAKDVNQQVRLEEGLSLLSIRPGIVKETISFGPSNQPNTVFRHSNFVLYTNNVDSSDLQRQDASFYVVRGLADPKGVSFKSYNFPNRYLRHSSFGFYLHPKQGDPTYLNDTTFYIKDPAPVSYPLSFRPSSSNLLGKVDISANYQLSFDLTPNGTTPDWGSIFHITLTGGNCCNPGDRVPGIWFNPTSLSLHVRVGDSSDGNWGFDAVPGCVIGKTSRIVLRCVDSIVTLSIDGRPTTLRQPTRRPSGQGLLYGGDPWYAPANASVNNLTYNAISSQIQKQPQQPPLLTGGFMDNFKRGFTMQWNKMF